MSARAFLLVQVTKPKIAFGTEGQILASTNLGQGKGTRYRVKFGSETLEIFGGDLLVVDAHDHATAQLEAGQEAGADPLRYTMINSGAVRELPRAKVLGGAETMSCRFHFIKILGEKIQPLG